MNPVGPSTPPVFTTRLVDKINLAMQIEKWRDIFLKRWWIISLCVSLPLIVTAYRSYKEPDVFVARGSMMVRPRINLPINDAVSEEYSNFWGTQIQLMQSVKVTDSARDKLQEEGMAPIPVSLSVYQEKGTSIFRLSATSSSPLYAEKFLDYVMREYAALKRKLRDETSNVTAATMSHEAGRLRDELDKVEQELIEFQKSNNMAYIEVQGNSAAQYLAELNRRLADVRTEIELLDAETSEEKLSAGSTSPILSRAVGQSGEYLEEGKDSKDKTDDSRIYSMPSKVGVQSELVSIKGSLTLLNAERQDLLLSYQPKHPRIQKLDEEIERKQRLYKIALQQVKDRVMSYRDSLKNQEKALTSSVRDWEKKALDASQIYEKYSYLKEKKSLMKESYDILNRKLRDIELSQNLGSDIVSINDPAKAQKTPIGPNRPKDITYAGFGGLGVAFILILLLERFDDRVKTLEDLQELTQETVLGQIPLMQQQSKNKAPLCMVDLPPHNMFSESFRNVRSSLMFSPSGGKARTIVVTSAIPNDGKTTCAVNLSICLAQIEGGKTLLIDADMRKMNIHSYFGMENGPGLSDVLSGKATLDECIIQTSVPELYLLRAGDSPPNPGELILSENFKLMLESISNSYQRIILDTPPVLSTDDALSLAPVSDGVIFVVKANQTSIRFVDRSMVLLRQRGAKIFGLILNHIDTSSAHYYYYYYYTGYYNYSSSDKSGSSRHARKEVT